MGTEQAAGQEDQFALHRVQERQLDNSGRYEDSQERLGVLIPSRCEFPAVCERSINLRHAGNLKNDHHSLTHFLTHSLTLALSLPLAHTLSLYISCRLNPRTWGVGAKFISQKVLYSRLTKDNFRTDP